MAVSGRAAGEAARAPDYGIPFVIGASSAGTVIEWYDFYLYALLTPFLAPLFFPSDNPSASLLAGFAVYGAGFAVRPFGAVVFGRIGAAIYVAEHAPDRKRGLYTSWIQTTATVGMFAALGVILATRLWFGDDAYRAGGWRVPFLIS